MRRRTTRDRRQRAEAKARALHVKLPAPHVIITRRGIAALRAAANEGSKLYRLHPQVGWVEFKGDPEAMLERAEAGEEVGVALFGCV